MRKEQFSNLIQAVNFSALRGLARQNGLDWLVIYGSRVYGQPTEDSDLDIGYDGPIDILNIPSDIAPGLELDIHCARLVNPGARHGMALGLLIYERESGVFETFKKRTRREFRGYVKRLKKELEEDLKDGYTIVSR